MDRLFGEHRLASKNGVRFGLGFHPVSIGRRLETAGNPEIGGFESVFGIISGACL